MDQFCRHIVRAVKSMLAGLGEMLELSDDTGPTWSFKQASAVLGAKQTDTMLLSPEKVDGIMDTRKAGPWAMRAINSKNSSSYGNLKGSSQTKFRLCYFNLYLKVLLEIWALQLIWFSAPQKQANWSFSKTEFSLSKVSFLHFKSFFFETVLWNKMVLKTMFSLIVETLLRSWILSSCLTQKFSYLINVLSR